MDNRLNELETMCNNMLLQIKNIRKESNIKDSSIFGFKEGIIDNKVNQNKYNIYKFHEGTLHNKVNQNKYNIYSSKHEILNYLNTNKSNFDVKYNKSSTKTIGWRNNCNLISIDNKYIKILHQNKTKTLIINKIVCIIQSDSDILTAMKNYDVFRGESIGTCNPSDVINSSAGVSGWLNINEQLNTVDDKFIFSMKNFNIGSNANKRSKT